MSVDTVIHSISVTRRRFVNNPENFSEAGKAKLLAILDCMRDPLMKEDIEGFDRYVDSVLAREPDAADFVLEEVFEGLGIETRDQLTLVLLA